MIKRLIPAFGLTLILTNTTVMAIEKPEYEVLFEEGKIEYRLYDSYIVAETAVNLENGYNKASNEGFRRLFNYITGANARDSKIDMTAPVQMSMPTNGKEIDMTAPVQSIVSENSLQVAFMLPSEFSFENAPQPTDHRVSLRKIPKRIMAVIRYSGRWTESNRDKYTYRLRSALDREGIEPLSNAESAAYNAPFTPPFLRRNEIMFEVEKHPKNNS